jgi:adenylate cyclase
MAKEIERKFLVKDLSFINLATRKVNIVQGYLSRRVESTVRVRIFGDSGKLTVKGANCGMVRSEWEYDIPEADAREMLSQCAEGNVIEKTRYIVPFAGFVWEVDEFHGGREGLIVAEIELPDAETQFPLPVFIGEEVTGDAAYYNSNL